MPPISGCCVGGTYALARYNCLPAVDGAAMKVYACVMRHRRAMAQGGRLGLKGKGQQRPLLLVFPLVCPGWEILELAGQLRLRPMQVGV